MTEVKTDIKTITMTVNGTEHRLHITKRDSLLQILREKLQLTGAKEGCGYGKCGTCTVVMNGKAVTACTVRGEKMDGADVLTIEGLADGFELHPIQKAMVESGAIQCGFCTPGIVMRLYALFANNLKASKEEIKEELSHHLCRCTGYESITEGALLAQKYMENK